MPVQSKENLQIDTLNYILKVINNTDHDYLIIGGDMNIHLDSILDKGNLSEKKGKNNVSRQILIEMLNDHNLSDILRVKNEHKKLNTWSRGNLYSRLDYLFISDNLLNFSIDSKIIPSILTDHKIVKCKIIVKEDEKYGKGTWKQMLAI